MNCLLFYLKKIILSLSIAFFITTNVFAAGSSSGGDGGSSASKTNYDKAVVHIKSAKKLQKEILIHITQLSKISKTRLEKIIRVKNKLIYSKL